MQDQKIIINYKLCFLCIFLSVSCSRDINYIVEKEFNKDREQNICYINLGSAMPFKWDTLYCFSSQCPTTLIDSVIGLKLNHTIDGDEFIVFRKKNKLICQMWFYLTDIDKTSKARVVFVKKDTINKLTNYLKIEKNNAIFKVEKKQKSYYLIHVEKND